jgi:hypothetical protein
MTTYLVRFLTDNNRVLHIIQVSFVRRSQELHEMLLIIPTKHQRVQGLGTLKVGGGNRHEVADVRNVHGGHVRRDN